MASILPSFKIPDPFSGEAVEYEREGELMHIGGNHYIAHLQVDGVECDYDDLVGRRKRLDGYSPLLPHDAEKWQGEKECLRIYTRVSKNTTVRTRRQSLLECSLSNIVHQIERTILELTADVDMFHDAERRVNDAIQLDFDGEVIPQMRPPAGETPPPPIGKGVEARTPYLLRKHK